MNNTVKNQKTSNAKNKTPKRVLLTALSLLFWIGVWYIVALYVGEEWILPTPYAVMRAFIASFEGGRLPLYLLNTLLGISVGYLAGLVIGFFLAAATAKSKVLHTLFSPLLTVVRATPIASFILILWIFFARESVPAFSVALIVTPIVWGNCETGFLSRDKALYEVIQVYDIGFWSKVRFLYLPSVYPYFKTAALTALGMAWKAGVAAEVLCTPDGTIGRMIWISKRDIETAELLAWTLAVVLTCFFFEKLLMSLFTLLEKTKNKRRTACSGLNT